jgi:glyoxylase-like metal-dependent hydrolase (beta-lactamase superfamily II)
MIRVGIIQTGTVTIRPHHRCGEEGRTAWQRKLDLLRDRGWTQPLPIYAYLIEHPEGIYLVDTGDRASNSDRGYLPRWNPFFHYEVQVKVAHAEEIGVQLAEKGIDVKRDVKGVLMTHLHHDHAGGFHHFPHTPIFVGRENYQVARSLQGRLAGCLPQRWPTWFHPTLIEITGPAIGPYPTSWPVTRDGRIAFVETPGHMRGHLSILVQEQEILYCLAGDATYDIDLLLTNQVDGVTYDVAVSQRTLERIRLLARQQPTMVLPAHDPGAPERLVKKRCLLVGEEAL